MIANVEGTTRPSAGVKQLGEHSEQKRSEQTKGEQSKAKQSFKTPHLVLLDYHRSLYFTGDDTQWLIFQFFKITNCKLA